MDWTLEMTSYLLFAIVFIVAIAVIFRLADNLAIAELERDLANYELKKLQAYRDAKETYDSQG